MIRFIQCVVIGLSLFWGLGVQAVETLSIYRAYGSVKNQSDEERNAAIRLHLAEVVVRASGRQDAVNNPVIRQAIGRAAAYMFSFSYTGKKVELVEGKPTNLLGIQLDYSPQAINQLLKEAQLSLWPAQRPTVLLWTVYRDLANSGELQRVPDEITANQLQLQANLRGLKIKMPELDLEDNIALLSDDLWQLNTEKIKAASLRYKADVVVVARYQSTSSGWVSDWSLLEATSTQDWRDRSIDAPQLMTNFVNKLADYFAGQYAINLGQQNAKAYYMHISHIQNFSAMKKSQAYLKSLPLVQKSELINVDETGLLLALSLEGDIRLLESTLALGKHLYPEAVKTQDQLQPTDLQSSSPLESEVGTLTNPLRYFWRES